MAVAVVLVLPPALLLVALFDTRARVLAGGLLMAAVAVLTRLIRMGRQDLAPVSVPAPPAVVAAARRAAHVLGLPVPAVRLTLGHDVRLRHDDGPPILLVGLPVAAVSGPAALEAACAHALLMSLPGPRRAEALARRLAAVDDGLAAGEGWLRHALRSLGRRPLRLARSAASAHDDAATARVECHWPASAFDVLRRRDEDFDAFWAFDVEPVLAAGRRPPIALAWRAVTGAQDGEDHGWDHVERELLAGFAGGGDLEPISWAVVGEVVWLPRLHTLAEANAPLVAGHRLGELGAAASSAVADAAQEGIAASVAVALHDAGWAIEAVPGEPLCLVDPHGDVRLDPRALVAALAQDPVRRVVWARDAAALGVADEPLVVTASPARAPRPAGHPVVEVPLVPSRAARRALTRRVWLAGLLGGPFVAAFLGMGLSDGVPAVGRLFLTTLALLLGLAVWAYARTLARARGAGVLRIGPDRVELDCPGLLRAPWRLPRVLLRTVAFDDVTHRRAGDGAHLRLLLGGSGFEDPRSSIHATFGALVEDGWTALPAVAAPLDRPNLALIFTEPVAGPRVRVKTPAGPLGGEAIGGLLLVADPTRAPALLAEHGLLSRLTREDARLVAEAYEGQPT